MTQIGHSTGLLLLDGNTVEDTDTASFKVGDTGIDELYGWGHSSSYPPLEVNPPEGAVHVVWVGELTDGAKTAIRELAGEHVLRYGECRIFTYPEIGPIAAWIAAGSPDPSDADQTAVAGEILANQQAKAVNQPDASPVANGEEPGTETEFVPDTPESATSNPTDATASGDAWETEGRSEAEVQEDTLPA